MECPMCYDLYNPSIKIPRNMNCGHTICEECLDIVYDKKKYLDCPTCRYKHDPSIKPSSLSKNFIALQLACHKIELRNNHDFCPRHDEPYKFFCSTDSNYICVECIPEHTGHHFQKQDQSFFTAKKKLSAEILRLDNEKILLQKFQSDLEYVKNEAVNSHKQATEQLERVFESIRSSLTREEQRSKEELNSFLENVVGKLQLQQKQIVGDMENNTKQRGKVVLWLQKLEKFKQAEEDYQIEENQMKRHKKPTVMEFPVFVMPFTGEESFVQICHKITPKICFFGERKKLLTLCPLTHEYSLTTLSNFEIQYYASACTLPTGEIFITGGGSSSSCFLFRPREPHSLDKKKPMANARKEHSCVYLAGKVYVISGYDGKSKGMAGCEAYDIFREEWRAICGLNSPRCAFAATVCNSKIYVFGGYDGKQRLSSIQVFTPETNKWTVLTAQLSFPLSNAAAVGDGKYIYILGGGWSQGFNHEVFQFNIETHEISSYQKMPKGRDLRNKAIKFKNQIYTIGGNFYDGEMLDLRQGEWSDLKAYNDLANDNLDSWCCALSYNSHEYELQKYQEMSKLLQKKYKEVPANDHVAIHQ